MFKSCAKCGKIHDINQSCEIKRTYKTTDESKLRSRHVWTEKSRQIRSRANHLCEVCRDQGIITYDNLEVHHIIKIKDDNSKFLEDDNLIVLCTNHHKEADRGDLDSEYLQKLVRLRDSRM